MHGFNLTQEKLLEPHTALMMTSYWLHRLLTFAVQRAPGTGLRPMPHPLHRIGPLGKRWRFTETRLPGPVMRLTSGATFLPRRLRRSRHEVCGKTPDAEIVKHLIVLVDAVEVKLEISADVSSSVLRRPDGHREREDAQVRAARVRIGVIEVVLKRR